MPSLDDSLSPASLRRRGYLSVFCAMLVTLRNGVYYSYSNINPYCAAYLGQFDSSLSSKDTLLVLPVWLIFQSLFALVGVKLSERLGYVKVNAIGFLGFAAVQGIMIFVKGYWLFIFMYGMMAGLLLGLGYLPSMYIAWTYFPTKKSIVTGVILFTAGISASLISPITTYIVNPDNLPDYTSNPVVYERVPKMFLFLFVYFGAMAAVAVVLQPPPYVSSSYVEKKELDKEEDIRKSRGKSLKSYRKSMLSVDGRELRMSVVNRIVLELEEKNVRVYNNEELKNDLKVMNPQSSFLMAALDPDKITDLIQNKDPVDKKFNDFSKSLRLSTQKSPFQIEAEIEEMEDKIAEEKKSLIYSKSVKLMEVECPSVKVGLKSKAFMQIAIMAFGCSIVNYFMNSVWKDFYRMKFDVTDDKMSLMLTLGGLANSLSRLIAGFLMQYFPFKIVFLGLVTLALFTCITINIFVQSYFVGLIYLFFVFIGIGTQVTIFPTITTKVFGSTVGPKIYPFVYLCFSMANLFQYFILKIFSNWSAMFIIFGGLATLALVTGVIFDDCPDWRGQIVEETVKEAQDDIVEIEGDEREMTLVQAGR